MPFRPNAVPFALRNEASVLYAFDEANRKALKKSPLGRHGPDTSARALAALARRKLFAEFLVTRGLAILGEVAVGPPPSAGEVAGRSPRPAQDATLLLPSGCLRLETANSFSPGPDPADEPGLFVDVPPGEYVLTLVELDLPADAPVPGVLLTLSPAGGTEVPAAFVPVTRSADPPPPPLAKYAAYEIEGGVFRGRVSPDGWFTNFDAQAAAALGLRFGSAIRVTVGPSEVDAFFTGDAPLAVLQQLADPALKADNPVVSQWLLAPDLSKEKVLNLVNLAGTGYGWGRSPNWKWRPLTLAPSPGPPLSFGPLDPGECEVRDGVLRGRVLTRSPDVLTVNVSARALETIGALPRDATGTTPLVLTAGGETRRLTVFKDRGVFPAKRFAVAGEIGDAAIGAFLTLRRHYNLGEEADADAIVAAVGDAVIKQLALGPFLQRLRAEGPVKALEPRPFPRPPALFGACMPHWSTPGRQVLWVEAATYLRDAKWLSILDKTPAPHEVDAAPGAEVVVAPA